MPVPFFLRRADQLAFFRAFDKGGFFAIFCLPARIRGPWPGPGVPAGVPGQVPGSRPGSPRPGRGPGRGTPDPGSRGRILGGSRNRQFSGSRGFFAIFRIFAEIRDFLIFCNFSDFFKKSGKFGNFRFFRFFDKIVTITKFCHAQLRNFVTDMPCKKIP